MLKHMMDWYDMSDLEREIRDLALAVARDEVAPRATKHDEEATFVRDSLEAIAEAGLFGVNVPTEYGGLGGGPMGAVLALEAISAACGSTGASYLFHLNLCHLLGRTGPESLRQKYLPQLAKDKLGSFAINERVQLFRASFETTLEERNGDVIINGHKPFSTSAGEADITVVQAQRGRTEFGLLGQEYILVERGTPGLSARVYNPMGLRGASNGSIAFEEVKVPSENIVGDQPAAMMRAVVSKVFSVLGPNVVGAGIAGAAVEAAGEKVWERGPEDWDTQMLGEMTSRLNALRAYNYFSARVVPLAFEGRLLKEMAQSHIEIQWLGGEDAPWICDRALETIGGSSFMFGSPVQRYYRDARGSSYLAFSMDHRRLVSGQMLFATVASGADPESMPWDPQAAYHFAMSLPHTRSLPQQARDRLGRAEYEEYARSQGSDEVTLKLFVEYVNSVMPKTTEGAPGGGPPFGPPGGPPGGGPPAGGPPAGRPPEGVAAGGREGVRAEAPGSPE